MQKLVRLILSFALVLGFGQSAYAEFVSIYSTASTAVPVPSSATPIVLSGSFQNLYAPTGVSGCSIGVTSLKSLCSQPGYGALQLQFPGYSFPPNANEVKVYIPAGTMRFTMVASMPQGTIAAAALRMDTAPTRVAELSNAEYSAAQSTMKYDTIFSRLLAGSEVIQTHDGGGTFTIAWGYANGSNSQYVTPTGHWLYIRFINYVDLYQVMASTLVNLTAYQTGYSSIQWDGNGDPLESGSSNSGNGTTTPPVTTSFAIALGSVTLTQGVTSTIGITPNATLSSCSASSVAGAPSYSNNTITLTPSSTATSVTVTCTSTTGGTATATLPVQAAPTTTTAFSSFTLSPSSLLKTDTATLITVKPNTGAVVPASTVCQVMQSQKYLVPAGTNQWKINPDSSVKQIAQSLTIDCGNDASGKAIASSFSILEPLTITRNSTDLAQLTDLTFTFMPTLPTGISTADLYIFVYVPSIPISAFKQTTTLYGYQVKNGKVQIGGSWTDVQNQLLPILFSPPDAYQKYVSSGTSFTVNLGYGVKGDLATAVKAEYYVAYLPTGTTDLTKLQFIGDKQGSFSGIPVFWKF